MNIRLKEIEFSATLEALTVQNNGIIMINTINAHSYNLARKDNEFAKALLQSDVLLPDGESIVKATRLLRGDSIKRIAGWDLFEFEMIKLNSAASLGKNKVLFLGSTIEVLTKIKEKAAKQYPHVAVHTYSPPYKPEFNEEDNQAMIDAINNVNPDVLFIGMTAPKQEKWAWKLVNGQLISENRKSNEIEDILNPSLYNQLSNTVNCHICCIGAVFDFYAGTVKRAPLWWQLNGLEWLYRFLKEPTRMWRRYLVGNVKFIWYILLEKILK
ncbi:MAG: WecB/TagA/CpsF family glycosyltransferase [Paludibacter sp.]